MVCEADGGADLLAGILVAAVLGGAATCGAQTADQGWLRYGSRSERVMMPIKIRVLGGGALEQSAVAELKRSVADVATGNLTARATAAVAGETVVGTAEEVRKAFPKVRVPADLGPDEYWIYWNETGRPEHHLLVIAGGDERGALFGAFALLRLPATTELGKARNLGEHPLRGGPAMRICVGMPFQDNSRKGVLTQTL